MSMTYEHHNTSQYPFDRFASIRRYTSFDFLRREPSWIVYTADTSGQFNLWRQRSYLSENGEPYAPHQLTTFVDETVREVFTSPSSNSIVFFADHHGSENFQIYKIDDIFNSWPQLITHNPHARHEWGMECFSRDGRYITYSSNESCPLDMKVYIYDIDLQEHSCLTTKEGMYIPGYWSPDNKKLNSFQLITFIDYNAWLLYIDNKEMINVTPEKEEKGRYFVGPWLPDGSGYYVMTDLKHEYMSLALYDINKSRLEWILTPNHDIQLIDLNNKGNMLVWSENVDGYNKVYSKNLVSGEMVEFLSDTSKNGTIQDLKISPDGKKIAFIMSTPISPSNLYVIDIETGMIQLLTNALLGNIPKSKMVEPDLIKYTSFDGLELQAFLYRAKGSDNSSNINQLNEKGKFGALLSIHGGPTAQERPTYAYAGLYQYLANNGIVVLAPNFRGSTGYGKSFEKKIYHDWGGNELKDLEYAVKWLLSQNWVDENKIGVFGASFGGFATLSCVARLTNFNFRAAVDIFGPSNLITFTKSVPEHWKRFIAELVGDPEKEGSFLKDRSPITFIDNINPTTNLLIIQGANDPRVVKNESDQIVERLISRGIDAEYVVFEDEGHGFSKYSNLVKAMKQSADFLVRRLS